MPWQFKVSSTKQVLFSADPQSTYEHHCCGGIFMNNTAPVINVKGVEKDRKSPSEDPHSIQRGLWTKSP